MSKIENLEQNYTVKKIDRETINIKVHNNDILVSVVGEFYSNLNELEKLTKTKIFLKIKLVIYCIHILQLKKTVLA